MTPWESYLVVFGGQSLTLDDASKPYSGDPLMLAGAASPSEPLSLEHTGIHAISIADVTVMVIARRSIQQRCSLDFPLITTAPAPMDIEVTRASIERTFSISLICGSTRSQRIVGME